MSRECGVLSLGVPRERLLVGKALGLAGALSLVLVPTVVVGVAALTMTAESGLIDGHAARGLLMGAAHVVYLTTFVGLSLAASALMSSRLALVSLLAFWMVNGLMVPRIAADVANRLHRLPSAIAFRQALERDLNDTREVESRLAVKRAALLEQYNVTDVDKLPVGFSGLSLQAGEEHGNQVFDEHYASLFDTYDRQNRTVVAAGIIAPLVAMQSLSMALAGTDMAHHRHFVAAAEGYRRMMQGVLNDDIFKHQKPGEVYMAGGDLWSQIPQFEYVTPSTTWVVRQQWPAMVLLALWAAIAMAAARWAVRRAAVA